MHGSRIPEKINKLFFVILYLKHREINKNKNILSNVIEIVSNLQYIVNHRKHKHKIMLDGMTEVNHNIEQKAKEKHNKNRIEKHNAALCRWQKYKNKRAGSKPALVCSNLLTPSPKFVNRRPHHVQNGFLI